MMVGDEENIPALLAEAKPLLFSVTLNGADQGADQGADGTSWQRLIRPMNQGSYDLTKLLGRLDEIRYQGPIFQQGFGSAAMPEDLLSASMQAWRAVITAESKPLPYPAAWQSPAGNWKSVSQVTLDAADEHRLSSQAGEGVFLNGVNGKEPDLRTCESFADVELHVEFMIGKKSNSGVYLMSTYEFQVYDSFGVAKDKYPGIECGGIYPQWIEETNQCGHSPRINASKPAGEWQSFDITFQAPRFDANGNKTANAKFVKVVHNGVTVHENVELLGPTRSGNMTEKVNGPLRLQGDHGPIAYRNLRIRPLSK
ncbi:MAG: DUF1080 domain-containing protein [Gloeobacteraceae cyanobacterium ES-bin-144]|nr:DUF1080 domain-containing protein [Verrucomicrobiales bacterium]